LEAFVQVLTAAYSVKLQINIIEVHIKLINTCGCTYEGRKESLWTWPKSESQRHSYKSKRCIYIWKSWHTNFSMVEKVL